MRIVFSAGDIIFALVAVALITGSHITLAAVETSRRTVAARPFRNLNMMPRIFLWLLALLGLAAAPVHALAADRPNVLMIVVDDLNDWIGCLGGHLRAVALTSGS